MLHMMLHTLLCTTQTAMPGSKLRRAQGPKHGKKGRMQQWKFHGAGVGEPRTTRTESFAARGYQPAPNLRDRHLILLLP
jgi:hypothetical protein